MKILKIFKPVENVLLPEHYWHDELIKNHEDHLKQDWDDNHQQRGRRKTSKLRNG